MSETDYIRVSTFEDQFIDVSRAHFENVAELKSYVEQFLGCPAYLLKILYAGRELKNDETLEWMDRVYACTRPAKKFKGTETNKKTCQPPNLQTLQRSWPTSSCNTPN